MSDSEQQTSTSDPTAAPARVSVVVPSYNHARYIGMALRSIMKQTHPPAELVVIDDGSTDGSPTIIEASLKVCPFACELIVRNNRGLCATLNEGLTRTRGEYFAYLGSDDVWLPDFLKERVRLLEAREDVVLAYGHAYLIDEQNRIVDCTSEWADYADGDARQMLLKTTAPMSPTVVYRRTALEDERWDEEAKLEDYDLYLRLSARGPFAFDPQVLSAWRWHAANTSWDQAFMLAEQLKAQRQAAAEFGLNDLDIDRLQTVTKFSRAEDFLRLGHKRQALRLMAKNIDGLRSLKSLTRMLARFLIPFSLMQKRQGARRRRYTQQYGSIEI